MIGYGLRAAGFRRVLRGTAVGIALVVTARPIVEACTVFYDARPTGGPIAAQNEDWDDGDTQLWTVPATASTHGVLYFGFGRGEYPDGGIHLSPAVRRLLRGEQVTAAGGDLHGLPQQGINDAGLFFGGAETAPPGGVQSRNLPRYDGAIVDLIMRRCSTVREALDVLAQYEYALPAGNLLFGDRGGHSFILEPGHKVIANRRGYQVATNFLQSKEPWKRLTDSRYMQVSSVLGPRPASSREVASDLLRVTRQANTQYSLVFELKRGVVVVYRAGRFDEQREIDVKAALSRPAYATTIRALFTP